MAGEDFEGRLIKAIEEINAAHANGALRLAPDSFSSAGTTPDARINFLFGAPYHALAGERKGMEALDAIVAAILAGADFSFDSEAPVDRDNATITLSSVRLIRRVKEMASPPKPPAPKPAPSKAGKAPSPTLDATLAAEKIPFAPQGEEFAHDQKSIPAILFHLASGVIEAASPSLRALVVVVDGRLVDAAAVSSDAFFQGPEALDAITADNAKSLNVRVLPASIASALPLFWQLPVRVRDLGARWLGGAAAVSGFIKPDARGVIQVRTDEDTALIFFDRGQVLLAYSQRQPLPVTDLALLAAILGAESAVISARLEDELPSLVEAPTPTPQPASPASVVAPVATQPPPPPVIPAPASVPVPAPQSEVSPTEVYAPDELEVPVPSPASAPAIAPTPAPEATRPTPQPTPPVRPAPTPTPEPEPTPTPPPAGAPAPTPTPAGAPVVPEPTPTPEPPTATSPTPPWAVPATETALDPSVVERIVRMVESELAVHAPAIAAEFRAAPATRSELLKVARKVRAMRPRLVSEERMESIGTRAINLITGREA